MTFEYTATKGCYGWWEMTGEIEAKNKKEAIKILEEADGNIFENCETCTEMNNLTSDMLLGKDYRKTLENILQLNNLEKIHSIVKEILEKEITDYKIQNISKL